MIYLDGHADRTLGGRAMEGTIIAHVKTAQIFRNRPTIFKGQIIETGAAWETYNDAVGLRWASPDITFTHSMTLNLGGPEILLESQPGPTPGGIWAIVPDYKLIFVGDTVVIDQPPFLEQADIALWLESLDTLEARFSDYTIVAGRGGAVQPEHLRRLRTQLNLIQRLIETLAETKAPPEDTADLLPELMAAYPVAGELETVYQQRLLHGLFQYYARRYHPSSALEANRQDETES
jgi:glyoxylase-like metal-dependent hydrolase (beta-lactamase superfamily II)